MPPRCSFRPTSAPSQPSARSNLAETTDVSEGVLVQMPRGQGRVLKRDGVRIRVQFADKPDYSYLRKMF